MKQKIKDAIIRKVRRKHRLQALINNGTIIIKVYGIKFIIDNPHKSYRSPSNNYISNWYWCNIISWNGSINKLEIHETEYLVDFYIY